MFEKACYEEKFEVGRLLDLGLDIISRSWPRKPRLRTAQRVQLSAFPSQSRGIPVWISGTIRTTHAFQSQDFRLPSVL
jgi:hypothetical protein